MCDTYCKRRAGEQLASPGIKRVKVSIDEEAATSTKQDTANVSAKDCSLVLTLKIISQMSSQRQYSIVVK